MLGEFNLMGYVVSRQCYSDTTFGHIIQSEISVIVVMLI